jgi:hypothetical protein
MMKNETDAILDDLLSRWHSWCRGNRYINEASADPSFRSARSSRQWDTLDEVIESDLTSSTMKAIDFQVGEMKDPHRSAIYINARNCATGREVWMSPRLPQNKEERQALIREARGMLMRRLSSVGVI